MNKELYNAHAEICKVFTNPTRLEILNLLRDGEMSVTELVEKTALSQVNVSQHLSIMNSKRIVTSRREGNKVYYSITTPKIIRAFDIIKEVLAERLEKGKLVREAKA